MSTSSQPRNQVALAIHYLLLGALLFALGSFSKLAISQSDQIGVYYFPGWKDNQPHAPSRRPWEPIKPFADRKPVLGWYDEGSATVMDQHIRWMKDYGLSFVVFDWYYAPDRRVKLEHALAAFMSAPNRDPLKFSILWANHDGMPKGWEDWESMVRYWVKYYFPRKDYLQFEGKPAVFVFSADELKKQAESFAATTVQLLSSADRIARDAGLTGIAFIAGTGPSIPMISSYAKNSGYAAFSAYNYHAGPGATRQSHSYAELDDGYRRHWRIFAEKGTLPLIVPMTSGWDKRPWGGSKDPNHDKSRSTQAEFGNHLKAAREFIVQHRNLTRGMGVICCWNEFGEGSFIEPTERDGTTYLEQLRSVFGK